MVTAAGEPFEILVVCTGNICRSPAGEVLLQDALGPSVRVRSAGTGALVGRAVDPQMASLLQSDKLDHAGFRARQLAEDELRGAGLVLAMDLDHRSAIVELAPATVRRTFTLLEFADIVGQLDPSALAGRQTPVDRLQALVPLATAARGRTRHDAAVEVPDPYRQSQQQFEHSYGLIRGAVDTIAGVVNP
ncbi:hypothetical protein ACQCX5_13095 [Propionibacteriaceae bacterium G57]|uniref:arsenate reductase/protein-tyrosine-phosphatase family protein n=1 Tax=Aestuariimicrobium sp. G57 TaxID=3418485 RepID=UPI003DA7614A